MFIINFDFKTAAKGLGLTEDEMVRFFLDGRRISMLLEKRIANLEGYIKAESESDPFDVIDPKGDKAEVRCLTSKIIFRPSDQIGMGRCFNEQDFYDHKIMQVSYFLICDVNEYDMRRGVVHCFSISSAMVWEMYKAGKFGKNAEKSRNTFLKLMEESKLYNRA